MARPLIESPIEKDLAMVEPLKSPQTREHRQRVLKGASILGDINTSEVTCTVRNQTAGGAELRVPPGIHIPDEFLLYVPVDGIAYKAVVRWRSQGRIGVSFTGTEPKPAWHYG
jgi:hypothetical protein